MLLCHLHHHLHLLLSTHHNFLCRQKPTFHSTLTPLLHAPRATQRTIVIAAAATQEGENEEDRGGDGPIQMMQPFNSSPSIFATSDDPSPIQVASSVLLTGAISVFLFRSLRRRARRSKELKFRSSGAKKTMKEEAIETLQAIGTVSVDPKKPPSPIQAFLGGVSAGVIALILYKFTITVESALNRQTISDNYSVRQLTISIRTIVNGLCYLATCVFGVNSIGLFLYSAQLAINSFTEGFTGDETENKGSAESSTPDSTSENPAESAESSNNPGDQNQ